MEKLASATIHLRVTKFRWGRGKLVRFREIEAVGLGRLLSFP